MPKIRETVPVISRRREPDARDADDATIASSSSLRSAHRHAEQRLLRSNLLAPASWMVTCRGPGPPPFRGNARRRSARTTRLVTRSRCDRRARPQQSFFARSNLSKRGCRQVAFSAGRESVSDDLVAHDSAPNLPDIVHPRAMLRSRMLVASRRILR